MRNTSGAIFNSSTLLSVCESEDGKDGESVDPNLHDAACRKITTAACREALQHSAVNAPITVIETLSAAAPRKGEDFAAITVGGVVVVRVDRSM